MKKKSSEGAQKISTEQSVSLPIPKEALELLQPSQTVSYVPSNLKRNKKKKRKRQSIRYKYTRYEYAHGRKRARVAKDSGYDSANEHCVIDAPLLLLLLSSFYQWQLTTAWTDGLLRNIQQTGLFNHFNTAKLVALGFLVISLLGARGRKNESLNYKKAGIYTATGLVFYFFSYLCLGFGFNPETNTFLYMGFSSTGFILVLTGGTLLSRVIRGKLNSKDIFNKEAETFPQEERRHQNEFSINLPARYNLKGRWRRSWINIINPFRALLVLGSPGSGKSYFIIRHVITQHIKKGLPCLFTILSSQIYHLLLTILG